MSVDSETDRGCCILSENDAHELERQIDIMLAVDDDDSGCWYLLGPVQVTAGIGHDGVMRPLYVATLIWDED